MKKWTFVAPLPVGATVLGATVLREPIARAAQSTATTIVGPLDASGNVKVHEQGTAAVSDTAAAGKLDTAIAHLARIDDATATDAMVLQPQVHINDGDPAEGVGSAAVPDGKRLVVDEISVQVAIPTGQEPTAFVGGNVGGQGYDIFVPLQKVASGERDLYEGTARVVMYADHPAASSGHDVNLIVARNGQAGAVDATAAIIGHIVPAQ